MTSVRFFLYSLSLFLISFTLFGHLAAYYYIYKPKNYLFVNVRTQQERKKIGRIFALRKKVFKFALLFRLLHTVSPQNTQLCSNFMSIRMCCFVFTYGRYWCFGSFNNKLIECCWWVHNNNRNTLPIHFVLSSAWCIFPFFSVFNVEIIAILHLQRGNIPRCCVDTSSNLSEELKKPTQKRLRQFSGLVIWHTILRIVRECGWGFSCEFKHVLLWIIDQISRHSIPKLSHLPTNTYVAFERCFAVASSHKNAAPSIWSTVQHTRSTRFACFKINLRRIDHELEIWRIHAYAKREPVSQPTFSL